jgi:predicted MFS family arabinose efflux permease
LRVQIVFFTFIRLVTSTAFRMVYPFLPVFRDALGVSLEDLTRAIGSRSLVAAFVGPFLAPLADSRGRRTGMLIGMSIFITGTLIVVFWPTFVGFVLALIFTLVGKVTFDPAMQAYLGDRVPYARRSLAITITELSWSGAFIFGIPLVGWVIARAGWLSPFPLLGLLVFLSAILLYLGLPKDKTKHEVTATHLVNFRAILKSPAAQGALLFTLFSCMANEVIGLIFGVWLQANFGLQLTALGLSAAVLGAAELSGEGLVAVITDRLGKRRAIITGLLVNSFATLVLPFTRGSLTAALAALFFFYISFEFTIVSSLPLMTEVMPRARATMMSGFFSFASIGRAAASWFTPWLYAHGFGVNAAVAIALNMVAIFLLGSLHLEAEAKPAVIVRPT